MIKTHVKIHKFSPEDERDNRLFKPELPWIVELDWYDHDGEFMIGGFSQFKTLKKAFKFAGLELQR